MSVLSLCRVELNRLFRDRRNWPLFGAALLCPFLGLWLYQPTSGSLSSAYLANPALCGALGGGLVFLLMTALSMDKPRSSRTQVLTDAVSMPLKNASARTAALLVSAIPTCLAAAMLMLPLSAWKMGAVFDWQLYASVYFLTLLPTLWFAVLFSASVYQLFRRLDVTLAADAAFALLSLTLWKDNWLLCWENPALSFLSDDFGNLRRILSLGWNRLFWIAALLALWLVSLLFVRNYGKSAFASFARNVRRLYLPALALVLASAAAFVYADQPFLDNSPSETDFEAFYSAEVNPDVTYAAIHVEAHPDLTRGSFYADATYSLRNVSGRSQTVSFWVNPGYSFRSVTANGRAAAFRDLHDDNLNQKTVQVDIPADEEIELKIEYGGFPREWNLTATNQGETEISRKSIYLANQAFSPLPRDMAAGSGGSAPFTARITLPNGMTPVLFGSGTVEQLTAGERESVWQMSDSGWCVILYAGDYVSEAISAAGLDIEFYYSAKHRDVMDACDANNVMAQVMDYCTEHYGPLHFSGEQRLRLLEIGTVGAGYAGGGASAMSEDSFSEAGLSDTLKGAAGSEVLAHEIIHQWWGLGNMIEPQSEDALWSSEGLTVYTTYRLMKELHGAQYAKKNYIDVWQSAVDDYYLNFYVQNPEYLACLPQRYQAQIANSYARVRQYCEMPLLLLKVESMVGGEEAMDEILSGLFTGKTNPDFPYLSWQTFLTACGITEEALNVA